MPVNKYSRSMKIQIMEESNLVFSNLGEGLYECLKSRQESEAREKLYSSEEVSEIFNDFVKVAIKQENGDFLVNHEVRDRMKKKTRKIVLIHI